MAVGIGGDDDPGRYRQPQVGHLRQVRSLATEQVLQVLVALGEGVDELRHCMLSLMPAPPARVRAMAGGLWMSGRYGPDDWTLPSVGTRWLPGTRFLPR